MQSRIDPSRTLKRLVWALEAAEWLPEPMALDPKMWSMMKMTAKTAFRQPSVYLLVEQEFFLLGAFEQCRGKNGQPSVKTRQGKTGARKTYRRKRPNFVRLCLLWVRCGEEVWKGGSRALNKNSPLFS